MQITPLPDTIENLVFQAGPDRSSGLHLSQIIQSLLIDLDSKRYGTERGPQFHNYIQAGFSFEWFLEYAFAQRQANIIRPGEIVKDGIAMSPDGIDLDGTTLLEYKFTWKSSTGCPDDAKFWAWKIQMMGYCWALGINKARLHAFFVNGDYKTKEPAYHVWELEFSPMEMAANWAMCLGQARAKKWLPVDANLHSAAASNA